jgi:putative Holliday junction resolvase
MANSLDTLRQVAKESAGRCIIMGLDFGLRRIGIALSDAQPIIASPFQTYNRSASLAEDARHLGAIIVNRKVCAIVVGLPLDVDNSTNANLIGAIEQLLRKINTITPLPPIHMQDERFTSRCAASLLESLGYSRKKSVQLEDKVAAALILQDAIDML